MEKNSIIGIERIFNNMNEEIDTLIEVYRLRANPVTESALWNARVLIDKLNFLVKTMLVD